MIRLNTSIALNYEAVEPSTFILNIQPVQNEHQRVSGEKLIITPLVDAEEYTQLDTGNRLIRFNAPAGQLGVVYQCTVDIKHRFDAPSELREATAAATPGCVQGVRPFDDRHLPRSERAGSRCNWY